MSAEAITTARLHLVPAEAGHFDALIAGDAERFAALLDAVPPHPFRPPPLTDDVLEWFRDQITADPSFRAWLFRWMVTAEGHQIVGSLGFAGPPDAEGAITVGYSVYPEYEGRGYAKEAVLALIEWALGQPGVTTVRATIKPDNTASRRVAAHAGLAVAGQMESEEEGLLDLWERHAG